MAFFARPNLENLQFKQLEGTVLTLSGQTQIATTSGLTLTDGSGGYIPITVTGGTSYDVLTYKDGVIKLEASTASGGTNIYSGDTPTTCEVGGMIVGSTLTGRTVSSILEEILVPTLDPTLTNPSISSFTISPTTLLYEVGTVSNITGTTNFNAGCINPQYTASSDCRSNGVTGYCYNNFGIIEYNTCSVPTGIHSFGANTIGLGNNTISSSIHYCDGVQPYDSSGASYDSPLSSGYTSSCSKTISGVKPWFWGTGTTAPDVSTSVDAQTLIDSYICKCVACSTGTINVSNFGVTGKYIWFATPYASSSKTCWQGANNPSNNGVIPGPLFPAIACWNIVSPESCWTSTCYKIYVSDYATSISYGMTFCN